MKLTKIKLINWHLFTNHTINVKGNFLITGENGCGKSTLIDAIYYVLSGGDDKIFNNAANVNAKRTLVSYVRGKLGNEGDGKEYLRNQQDVICHIALEYHNESDNSDMVLGCVVEIVDASKPKSKFYVVQDYSIKDTDYIVENKISSYFEFKNKLKSQDIQISDNGLKASDGKKKRAETIGRDIFKLDNKGKYSELLRKAIAFKPINEVSTFVDEFLLKDSKIDIDALTEEIRSYRLAKNQLDREQKKIDILEKFIYQAQKYYKNLDEISYLNALSIKYDISDIQKSIKKLEGYITRLNEQIEEGKSKIEFIDSEIKENSIEIANIESNNLLIELNRKKNNLEKIYESKRETERKLREISKILQDETKIINYFGFKYKLKTDIENNNFPLFKEHVNSYANDVTHKQENLLEGKVRVEVDINKIDEDLKKKQNELENINLGKSTYNKNTTQLMQILKEKLSEKYHKDIEVKPLCEYLEINDLKWVNAIEGYLNTQRFDIIIEPTYYDEAVGIYEKYKSVYNLHSVGIINCKAFDKENIETDSLFNKLDITNKYAKFAAYMILGKVVCVDNVMKLKNYTTSITDTCMVYKNRTVRNIKPETYKIPYIGKNSILKRKEILIDEITLLNKEKDVLLKKLTDYINDCKIIANSKADVLKNTDNVWANYDLICDQYSELERNIKEDEQDDSLLAIENQLTRAKEKFNNLKKQRELINENRDKSNIELGNQQNILSNKNKKLEDQLILFDKLSKDIDEIKFKDYENILVEDNKYNKNDIEKLLERKQNSNNSNKNFIINGMKEYVAECDMGLVASIENIKDFIFKYNQIKERDLLKFKDRAEVAYKSCQQAFKSDFVAKLASKIEFAKSEIRKLNKKLNDTPFGSDEEIYKFTIESSADDEMKEYYKLITSGKVMEYNYIDDELFDKKEQDTIKRLFDNIIIDKNDANAEKKLDKYLDYRNYMRYDIQTTNKRGEVSCFSKTNNEKSGGETQTPFYVIIAACFDQLILDENYQSTCTVIYDEAFNNMDESRIEAIMEFYKKLNIQIIVVVPTNRMATLANYMDTVVGLIKENNRIYVSNLDNSYE